MKSSQTACRHFNMIEMLKVEENKKNGGIGVSSKTKPVAISAIESEMSDDPEDALDLLDVLDDNPEASEEIQEELEVIKSNIYLPPEDEYEMDVANDKEDEAMKEMLALIESEKEKAGDDIRKIIEELMIHYKKKSHLKRKQKNQRKRKL